MMKPIIAVTTYGRYEKDLANPWYKEHFSLPAMYIDAIRRAGGIPLLLPPGEEDLTAVLAAVDGVLITGGSDIRPIEYGGNSQHPQLTVHDPERDKLELTLVRHLVNGTRLPTLCICRGEQVLNVALGGTLHEHVADLHPEDIHRNEDVWARQEVNVVPTSLLAEVMQATTVVTCSGHHQAVKEVAPGLRIAATAPDGIIEAIEHPGMPWMLGVQWHPEVTAAEDPTQQRLFDELVREAARYKSRN
jgi:putative glutamine amidotransferase